RLDQRRQLPQTVAQRRRSRVAADLVPPGGERLRTVEPEDLAARRLRIERVREPRLGAGRLVDERQRTLERRRNVVRDPIDVLRRLPGDAGERLPLLLRLQRTDSRTVDEEEVVGTAVTGREHELPHSNAAGGAQVDSAIALDDPPGGGQHLVDADARLSFRREV